MTSKMEAAVAWAARGFRVFPLGRNGKKPIWKGWTEWASSDPEQIRAMWEADFDRLPTGVSQEYNIGVLTTDMLVVDVDTKDGRNGLSSWMDISGDFDTLTVRTASGGLHLYYSGANVQNSQSELGEHLDVRGYHGYTVAPGSVVDGRAYTVEIDEPVRAAPAGLVARCRPPRPRHDTASTSLVELDTAAALADAMARVARTPGALAGEQSLAAYKLAAAVRDYGVSEHMAGEIMDAWADRCSPPILPDDLRHRIANAYQHAQNPAGTKHVESQFGTVVIPPLPDGSSPLSDFHGVVIPPLAADQVADLPPENPFQFGNIVPVHELRPRPWVYRRLLMAGEVTTLVAPGGVGKSLFCLSVAIHMALGLDAYGFPCATGPAKTIVYNAEDSAEEMAMRVYATCTQFGFDPAAVTPMLSLVSGKTHFRLKLVTGGLRPEMVAQHVSMLAEAAMDPAVKLIVLDPLSKLHGVSENDNNAMTFVMETLDQIATTTETAVMVAQHTGKAATSGGDYAGSADAGRGAAAVRDSARISLTLMPMTDNDALRYGIADPQERRRYLRLDGAKANRNLGGDETVWMRKETVRLAIGEEIGVLVLTDMSARREAQRDSVGRVLEAEMRANNVASLDMEAATKTLRAGDPLLATLTVQQVRSRLQQYLDRPILTASGATLRITQDAGKLKVLLE